MPAQRNTVSSLASSSSQASLRRQYDTALATASLHHNVHLQSYARGSHGVAPYPDIEDVFNRPNSAVVEDDDFSDIGLNDFLLAQRKIAHHKLRRHGRRANEGQHGLIDHALQDWDQGEPESQQIEASMMYMVICVRADLKPDHLVTKRCPLLPWNSGVAAGVLVGPD